MLMCLANQDRQRGTVVPWRLTSRLGQDDLLLQVNYSEPLQPVFPVALLLAEVLYPADKVAAHRGLRQSSGIDGYRGGISPPPRHAANDFIHHPRYIVFFEPRQKATKRGVIRYRLQLQSGSQLRVFAQPHLGLAKGPVLIAHQAQHGQQLRLGELTLAKLGALSRQHRLAGFQGQPSESYQSDFSHCRL
jgi:hypothetical protein